MVNNNIENIFYVYGLYRPDKQERLFYVGKGKNERMYDHRKEARLLLNSTKKKSLKIRVIQYLWKLNLDFEEHIIYEGLNEQEAFAIEEELIKKYGRISSHNGCLSNITKGGEGNTGHPSWNKGIHRTNAVKEKLRIANLGKTYSEDINKKKGRKGRTAWNKGKKISEEVKQKISEGLYIHYQSPEGIKHKQNISGENSSSKRLEVKKKISIASKGKKLNLTDEGKQKKSERMLGNTYMVGHKHSEETKEKIRKGNLGKIMSLESRKKMAEAKQGYIPWKKKKIIAVC